MIDTMEFRARSPVSTTFFSVRKIEAPDLPALAAMEAAYAEQRGGTTAATPEGLAQALFGKGTGIGFGALVAVRSDGVPLGYAVVCPAYMPKLAETAAMVSHLFVAPGVRRRGIGTALLQSVQHLAADWGCSALYANLASADIAVRKLCKSLDRTEQMEVWLVRGVCRIARMLGSRCQAQVVCRLALGAADRPWPLDGSGHTGGGDGSD